MTIVFRGSGVGVGVGAGKETPQRSYLYGLITIGIITYATISALGIIYFGYEGGCFSRPKSLGDSITCSLHEVENRMGFLIAPDKRHFPEF